MKKQIIANTFTPKYDKVEDRIRLAINYQDIHNRVDFMITRSFMLDLLPSAEEFMLKYYGIESLNSTKETNTKENKNLKDDKKVGVSKTDNVNFELFRASEELLIEVTFSINKKTNMCKVKFSSKNTIATTIIDEKMFEKLFSVIKSSIPYIKWGISPNF